MSKKRSDLEALVRRECSCLEKILNAMDCATRHPVWQSPWSFSPKVMIRTPKTVLYFPLKKKTGGGNPRAFDDLKIRREVNRQALDPIRAHWTATPISLTDCIFEYNATFGLSQERRKKYVRPLASSTQ